MQATIINYRGISSAVLDISKIALVAAHNGGGKSSIAQAVAAAATGEPVPFEGVSKSTVGVLVRAGTAAGSATITTDSGTAEVAWPSAKVKTTGQPPCASAYAVGLKSIVTMDVKTRTAFLIDYLNAKPSKDNLATALKPLNLPAGMLDKLWELITLQGWDGAHSQIKEKGAKLKGSWETVANEDYGAKKAESWLPTGWCTDLMGASEETLQATVTDARDALEAAISSAAVDDSKRADLQALADLLPERQAALESAKKPLAEDKTLKESGIAVQDAKLVLVGLQNTLEDLRRTAPKAGAAPNELACPCCAKKLMLVNGTLAEYAVTGPDQATLDAHALKISDSVKAVNAQQRKVDELEENHKALSSARQEVVDAWNSTLAAAAMEVTQANNALKELSGMAAASIGTGCDVEAARTDLAAHELRLKAFQSKQTADNLRLTRRGLLVSDALWPTFLTSDL
jgi:DNA repair exonuclease SbcCD ATPase subunit